MRCLATTVFQYFSQQSAVSSRRSGKIARALKKPVKYGMASDVIDIVTKEKNMNGEEGIQRKV